MKITPPLRIRWFLMSMVLLALGSGLRSHAQQTAPPADPHHIDGSQMGSTIDLTSAWLAKQGDDIHWTNSNFDDSHWQTIQA